MRCRFWFFSLVLMVFCSSGCQRGVIPTTWQRSLLTGHRESCSAPETALRQARFLLQIGRVDQALQTLLACHEQEPGNLKILNQIGVCYDLLGDHRRAQAIFQEILTVAPDHLAARNNLGYSYLLAGDYGRAEEEFQQVLQQEPGNERAQNNLGLTLVKQGKFDRALELWAASRGPTKAKELLQQVASQLQLPLPPPLAIQQARPPTPTPEKVPVALRPQNASLEEEDEAPQTAMALGAGSRSKSNLKPPFRILAKMWTQRTLQEKLLKQEMVRPLEDVNRSNFLVL